MYSFNCSSSIENRRSFREQRPKKGKMEDQRKEKTGSYAAVPKFGGWESATMPTDYSMVFATAREQKKTGVRVEIPTYNKTNQVSDDGVKGHLISQSHHAHTHKRTWLDKYFTCCINAA